VFESIIAFYGRTLRWALQFQTAVLLIAAGTLVLTIVLYIIVPKGFFPVQDTGIIQGISEAAENISFPAMAERQQALVRAILKESPRSRIFHLSLAWTARTPRLNADGFSST